MSVLGDIEREAIRTSLGMMQLATQRLDELGYSEPALRAFYQVMVGQLAVVKLLAASSGIENLDRELTTEELLRVGMGAKP